MRPFTRTDVWRGAMHAWGGFMVLMLIAFTAAVLITAGVGDAPGWGSLLELLPLLLLYAAILGGGISFVVTLVASPLAALLAIALRDVHAQALHLLAFAGLGAVVGASVVGIYAAVAGDGLALVPMVAVVAGISAIATAYGRWRAARTGRIRPLRDPDAAAEDATLVATD